jgi:[acyl-carrier-protein] S-malonyltransferase
MEPARKELEDAINKASFNQPICPVFQNVTASAETNPDSIKKNLIAQLTGPVKWTQTVQAMVAAGGKTFIEVGPGKVLQGLVKKVSPEVEAGSLQA